MFSFENCCQKCQMTLLKRCEHNIFFSTTYKIWSSLFVKLYRSSYSQNLSDVEHGAYVAIKKNLIQFYRNPKYVAWGQGHDYCKIHGQFLKKYKICTRVPRGVFCFLRKMVTGNEFNVPKNFYVRNFMKYNRV